MLLGLVGGPRRAHQPPEPHSIVLVGAADRQGTAAARRTRGGRESPLPAEDANGRDDAVPATRARHSHGLVQRRTRPTVAARPAAPSRHGAAPRPRRPRAAVPHGAYRPRVERRAVRADPRRSTRRIPSL